MSNYLRTKKKYLIVPMGNRRRFKIRTASTDWLVLFETWVINNYEERQFSPRTCKLILDVGAHIGGFSVYCAEKFPLAKIYAFEPLKENYNLLKWNLRLNRSTNVTSLNQAVSSRSGVSDFYIPDSNGAVASMMLNDANNRVTVDTVSLNEFIESRQIENVDFLKIDAEGSEYDILYGLSQKNLKKISYLTLEVHKIDGMSNSPHELITYLQTREFEVRGFSKLSLYWLIFGTTIIRAHRKVN